MVQGRFLSGQVGPEGSHLLGGSGIGTPGAVMWPTFAPAGYNCRSAGIPAAIRYTIGPSGFISLPNLGLFQWRIIYFSLEEKGHIKGHSPCPVPHATIHALRQGCPVQNFAYLNLCMRLIFIFPTSVYLLERNTAWGAFFYHTEQLHSATG